MAEDARQALDVRVCPFPLAPFQVVTLRVGPDCSDCPPWGMRGVAESGACEHRVRADPAHESNFPALPNGRAYYSAITDGRIELKRVEYHR